MQKIRLPNFIKNEDAISAAARIIDPLAWEDGIRPRLDWLGNHCPLGRGNNWFLDLLVDTDGCRAITIRHRFDCVELEQAAAVMIAYALGIYNYVCLADGKITLTRKEWENEE